MKGDRYIVRRPSPSLTVGGGQVIDAHPRRHKRFNTETLSTLETLQKGTPEELILQALGMTALDVKAVIEKSALDSADAERAIQALLDDEKLLLLAGDADSIPRNPQSAILMAEDAFQDTMRRVHNLLAIYHKQQPLRRGMSKEELRSRMSSTISARAFPHVMARAVERGAIAEGATTYRTPQHEPKYSPAQEAQAGALRSAYAQVPYSPPLPTELGVEPDVLAALVEGGELVKIDEGIYYARATLDEMRDRILGIIDEQGDINVALMRDVFGTTRKYAIPLLEYFDNQKITRRVGDVRVRW